ncbi:hypothetical protein J8N08_24635 (plasmid) [Agrobacterium tumefaciens]|uniref:hypothetical protein n=1 Tax=Agrobacterium TaxID=357 RepID=UPI000FDF4DD6|nr:hypothetical protein [Agrobacterium sp. RS6]QTQ85867.1 hypothetical protein J8N08_24635 [Agrobacterium tumefaciens]
MPFQVWWFLLPNVGFCKGRVHDRYKQTESGNDKGRQQECPNLLSDKLREYVVKKQGGASQEKLAEPRSGASTAAT